MRFSRDLPSAMPRPSQQTRSNRWYVLSGITMMIIFVLYTMQTGDAPAVSGVNAAAAAANTIHELSNANSIDGGIADTNAAAAGADRHVQSIDATADRYIIMIDAGSSGSRIHIHKYKWDRSSDAHALPDIQPSIQKKVKPGLSSYAKNPQGARKSIEDLLDYAKRADGGAIPLNMLASTPVYLQATAGLRSVTAEQAENVLQVVRDVIEESKFQFKRSWARIIDGKEEGVFGWLSANYLMGSLVIGATESTRGIVEMGGASMQLTYVPQPSPSIDDPRVDVSKMVEVHIPGKQEPYLLYTHSYLGYGLEAVQERHQHTNAIVDAVDLYGNPCYPVGYHHSSIGNWTLCHQWLQSVVPTRDMVDCPYHSCGIETTYQPPVTSEPFYAIENFFYTSQYFKVDGAPSFIDGLKDAGRQYCSRNWHDIIAENNALEKPADVSDLVKYCFATAYSTRVLEIGFGLPSAGESLRVMREINQRQIDWALGSVLDSLIGPTMRGIMSAAQKQQQRERDDALIKAIGLTNNANSVAATGYTGSHMSVWLSMIAVPMVACWVIVKQILPKWRR